MRATCLVNDFGVVNDLAGQAGTALDCAIDVVDWHRVLLGLADGKFQCRVARHVCAAGAGCNFDALDEFCEGFGALGVNRGLLVLGGCPFGVA
ncbi:hypothetical protein D3C73_1447860 [compost metagenome]